MNRDPKQVLTEWLVLAVQRGDEVAFRELHTLWQADLRRLCQVRLNQSEALDEVASDVWLAIARGLAGLDDPACFPRWAFCIVERRSADWIRRRGLERRRQIAAANEASALAPTTLAPPEPPERVAELRDALTRLSMDERELAHLYYEAERSIAEIAEVLALPPGTVKSRLFSLRETLRQMLKPKIS